MAQAASDAPSPPSSFSTSRMPGQTRLSHPARPRTTHTRQDRRCLDRSWRCVDSTAMEAQYGEFCNVDVLKEMRTWSPYGVGREEQRPREEGGAPNGIRIRAAGLKGRCPRPLDDGGTRTRLGGVYLLRERGGFPAGSRPVRCSARARPRLVVRSAPAELSPGGAPCPARRHVGSPARLPDRRPRRAPGATRSSSCPESSPLTCPASGGRGAAGVWPPAPVVPAPRCAPSVLSAVSPDPEGSCRTSPLTSPPVRRPFVATGPSPLKRLYR